VFMKGVRESQWLLNCGNWDSKSFETFTVLLIVQLRGERLS